MKRSRLKNIINKSKTVSNKQEVGNPFDEFKKSLPIEVDNKQMILSALTGTKVPKLQTTWQVILADNTRVLKPLIVDPIDKYGLITSLEYLLPEVIVTPTNDASWLFSDGKFKYNSRKPLADKYTRKIVSNYLSKFDNENTKDYNARISRLSDILDIRGVQFVENKVKSGKLKGRAHYNTNSETAYVNNMDDIFSEIAHPWQNGRGNNWIVKEVREGNYDSDSDPRGGTRYAYPDTAEGETHGFFEPILSEWVETGKIGKSSPLLNEELSKLKIQPKDRLEVVDSAASWNRQAIDRRIISMPNQLPLWERIKYNFVNYPLLNKSK